MDTRSSTLFNFIILSFGMLFIISDGFVNGIFNPVMKPIISSCLGDRQHCVVFNDGKMKCAGDSTVFGGSIEYDETLSWVGDSIPYFNPGKSLSITKVSCGLFSTCVILNTGAVKCVGNNKYGQAGLGVTTLVIQDSTGYAGDTLPVVNICIDVQAADIALGNVHACVKTTKNQVKCFGRNHHGQLGYSDTNNRGQSPNDMGNRLPYVKLGTNVEVASIHSSSNSMHNCVILLKPLANAQRIKCWGNNGYYQLGYGKNYATSQDYEPNLMGDSLPLVDLGTISTVKHLALGGYYTCALLTNNQAKCWGVNKYGQFGSGSTEDISSTGNSLPYVPFDSGKTIKYLSAGLGHICVVYDNQLTLRCVGANFNGQLGQGDTENRGHTPDTIIPKIPAVDLGTKSLQISSIYTGRASNCVIFVDYSVKCFGNNRYGQFARGNTRFIGDDPDEMGQNLEFSQFFSPTQSPTRSPTNNPLRRPTGNPSKFPTKTPTIKPTRPTRKPTRPFNKPTGKPKQIPSTNPTQKATRFPSKSPTI